MHKVHSIFIAHIINIYVAVHTRVCYSVFVNVNSKEIKMLNTIVTWFKIRNMRQKTIKELSRLSDRELADIGISRGNINFVAIDMKGI
jgi:uncharacterized protein YjiS (DUF1127 family)